MDDCRVRFQPIPRTCPIPRNVVCLIGGYHGLNPTFVLYLNGKEITIEAPTDPPVYPVEDLDPDHPFYDWHLHERSLKIYAHYLEIVQSMLGNIAFGKTNWAYLTYQTRTGYQITQRKRHLPRVTCPPWATFIHESEVEYTVFGLAGDRRGIWEGKEVDIMIGWTETHIASLNRAMYGYRMLEGMDLTYEVYGHLINSEGSIIGIVTEAAWGRMPTLKDRTRIYQTVAGLQNKGILYKGCLTNRFMIANGRVRLLDLASIHSFVDKRDELEREAEYWHWAELSQLFHEIETIGPYGHYRIPFHRFTSSFDDLECLPLPPSPERPLGGIMLPYMFFHDYMVEPWPGYQPDDQEQPALAITKVARPSRITVEYSSAGRSFSTERQRDGVEDNDRPLPAHRLGRNRSIFHPYNARYRRAKLLSGSDVTSSSSSDY